MAGSAPRDLLEAVADKRVVPFVGAGVSLSIRARDGSRLFPTWLDLLELAAKALDDNHLQSEATLVRALIGAQPPDVYYAAERAHRALKNRWPRFLTGVFARTRDTVDDSSLDLARAI